MDNKDQPTNPLASHLAQSIEHLDQFLNGLKTGEGLNLSEKDKEDFEKQKAEKGIDKSILDAQSKIEEARRMFSNMKK